MGELSTSVINCVRSQALICSPLKNEFVAEVGKAFTKMLFLHGQKYTPDQINITLKEFINQYQYESIETILLFLDKAGKGEFGNFFGQWGLATIYEWFADFLQYTIIPIRETEGTKEKEQYSHRTGIKTTQELGKDLAKYMERREQENAK